MSSGNWTNSDGLYIEFGTSKPAVDVAGEYKTYGDFREINARIDLTTLTSSGTIISQNLKFPKELRIARVDVISDTAATGSGATLDIGLMKEDRSTELDYNGLVAALPVASLATVGTITSLSTGTASAGALIGTSTSSVGYLTANYNTTAFTAGTVDVRIFLYGRGVITQ